VCVCVCVCVARVRACIRVRVRVHACQGCVRVRVCVHASVCATLKACLCRAWQLRRRAWCHCFRLWPGGGSSSSPLASLADIVETECAGPAGVGLAACVGLAYGAQQRPPGLRRR